MWPFKQSKLKVRQVELDSISEQLDILYTQQEAIRNIFNELESGRITSFAQAKTFVADEFLILQQKIHRLSLRVTAILTEQLQNDKKYE